MFLPLVPVSEIAAGVRLHCDGCGEFLSDGDEVVYWDAGYRCPACAEEAVRAAEEESAEFAVQECRITRILPRYDPSKEYRCTPEEYAEGVRESYTRNAHLCYCRHRCTNYEELIAGLGRDGDLADRILYEAIRGRIDELLLQRIEDDGDEDELDEGGED